MTAPVASVDPLGSHDTITFVTSYGTWILLGTSAGAVLVFDTVACTWRSELRTASGAVLGSNEQNGSDGYSLNGHGGLRHDHSNVSLGGHGGGGGGRSGGLAFGDDVDEDYRPSHNPSATPSTNRTSRTLERTTANPLVVGAVVDIAAADGGGGSGGRGGGIGGGRGRADKADLVITTDVGVTVAISLSYNGHNGHEGHNGSDIGQNDTIVTATAVSVHHFGDSDVSAVAWSDSRQADEAAADRNWLLASAGEYELHRIALIALNIHIYETTWQKKKSLSFSQLPLPRSPSLALRFARFRPEYVRLPHGTDGVRCIR